MHLGSYRTVSLSGTGLHITTWTTKHSGSLPCFKESDFLNQLVRKAPSQQALSLPKKDTCLWSKTTENHVRSQDLHVKQQTYGRRNKKPSAIISYEIMNFLIILFSNCYFFMVSDNHREPFSSQDTQTTGFWWVTPKELSNTQRTEGHAVFALKLPAKAPN